MIQNKKKYLKNGIKSIKNNIVYFIFKALSVGK